MITHTVDPATIQSHNDGLPPTADTMCGKWVRLTRFGTNGFGSDGGFAYSRQGGHVSLSHNPTCPKCQVRMNPSGSNN